MSVRRAVALSLVAAFVLRLAAIGWLASPSPVVTADALWYHSTATQLALGNGYIHPFTLKPTAAWPPGYPAILAAVYRATSVDPWFAVLLNAVAGTLSCWLAGRIALHAVSPRAQAVATALVAVAPSHVLFSTLVLTETVFTTILLALLLAAIALVQRSSSAVPWAGWMAWGAAVGLASLVRAEAVIVLAAPLLVLLGARVRIGVVAAVAAVAIAGIAAAQAPWLARNAALFGQLVPVSTSFGRTLVIGHNPVARGDMNDWSPDAQADMLDLASGDPARELAVDRRLRDAGIRFMLENPGREAGLVFRRFWAMFRGDRVWGEWYAPGNPPRVTPQTIEALGKMSNAFYWLLLAAALPAFVRSLTSREPAPLAVSLTIVVWTAFFVLVLYGTQRFHFPLVPLFAVLATATAERYRLLVPFPSESRG